jgi:hypothetical protein
LVSCAKKNLATLDWRYSHTKGCFFWFLRGLGQFRSFGRKFCAVMSSESTGLIHMCLVLPRSFL